MEQFFWSKLQPDLPLPINYEETNVNNVGFRPTSSVQIELQNEKANSDGYYLPVQWYKKPYLYLFLLDSSSTTSRIDNIFIHDSNNTYFF